MRIAMVPEQGHEVVVYTRRADPDRRRDRKACAAARSGRAGPSVAGFDG